jgi:methylated-DNA-protein-cysteine methyltransferase-like protein
MKQKTFSQEIIEIIKKIPRGKVATYGQIANLAGNRFAARQVVRILHSASKSQKLPWHRVVNSRGTISLKRGHGYEEQKTLLVDEGVVFDKEDRIDLIIYLWDMIQKYWSLPG